MSEATTNKKDVLQKLRSSEALFILYSGATRCPYVVCDPATYDDTVFIYFTEEDSKRAEDALKKENVPVNVIRLPQKHFLMFYTSLFTMGVNALTVTDGGVRTLLQLTDVVKRADPNAQDGKAWIENPSLHLTALYLMQNIRMHPDRQPGPELRPMLEEAIADFTRGRFIQPVAKEQKSIPLLAIPNGEKYQPVFTDILEFHKFNREDKFTAIVVDGAKITQLLAKEAAGVVVNPLGVNLPLKITRQVQPQADGTQAAGEQHGE